MNIGMDQKIRGTNRHFFCRLVAVATRLWLSADRFRRAAAERADRGLERPVFGQNRPLTPYITVAVCRFALRIIICLAE